MRKGMKLATFTSAMALSVMGTAAHSACPALPNNIVNGQTADASQLMANFNSLENCLNLSPVSSSVGITGAGGGTVSIKNPSTTTAYDFDLPTSLGNSGQVLTSSGLGQPLTWTTVPGLAKPPLIDGVPVGRPAATTLGWVNQGTTTASDYTNGPISLRIPNDTSGASLHGLGSAPITGVYTLTVKLAWNLWTNSTNTGGMYIQDSTGKLFRYEYNAVNNNLQWAHAASATAGVSVIGNTSVQTIRSTWLRITNDGTNWNFYESPDGANWTLDYSEALTNYLGSTITSIGVFGSNYNSTVRSTTVSIWSYKLESGTGTNSSWQ